MNEAHFRHPLLDAGWNKARVRAFAHAAGLSVAERPSNACLASRVRHGQPITAEVLRTVEAAEAAVADLGFRRVRVRLNGGEAKVEVGHDEVPGLLSEPTASEVYARLRRIGLNAVTLDPVGYQPRPGM
jgi:uncharacterized protein